MNADNENIEPETDLGLSLGYSNECIQRRFNSDSGAGANAGSRIDMTFVAAEPLSELVWSPQKGPSNVTLSLPESITGGRSAIDKSINEEKFITPQTSFHVKSEVAGKDTFTTSPRSDAGIMPVCGSSHEHETGTSGNVEEVKAAVEVCVPSNREDTCGPINSQIAEIPQTGEKKFTALQDQIIPSVEQNEPLLRGSAGGNRHPDVGNQKMEMHFVLTSEVHPVNENKASGAPVVNPMSQGRRPSDKLESTADNDLQNLRSEHAYGTVNQILGSEFALVVKDSFEQGKEMLPENKSVLEKHSPTNRRIHKYQSKGKEKALSDGEPEGRMSKDEDDSHESVESCNSAGLFSSGKKRWSFDEQFIVGGKRFRKQIQETPGCTSYIRQDSSFMNWISSMMKGFSKSMQDKAPSLALSLAHPDHGPESPDKKLITSNKNQDAGFKNIGFQSIFQSIYCPKAAGQETRILTGNNQIGEGSKELELDNKMYEIHATPKTCHRENSTLGRGSLLSIEKLNESTSGNEVGSDAHSKNLSAEVAACKDKGNNNSVENKNPCSLASAKKKDGVGSSYSLGKRKEKGVENIESVPQSEGKITDKFGRRSNLLKSLWITRFTPKTSGPSMMSDHHNQSAGGVLECFSDQNNVGAREHSAEDLVIVIGDDQQNCAADNEGSLAFNRNKGQSDQKSMSKLNPILPSPKFKGSEAMASVFARRLDALKHISPSGVTGDAARETVPCFFCGIKGHHFRECSEIRDTELQELQSKFKSYNGPEYFPSFCIRCFQCSHWAAACPNAPSTEQPQLECNASHVDYYCSPSETKRNAGNDGNMELLIGKENQFQASVAQPFRDEDYSRMDTDLNLSSNFNEMKPSKKMRYRSNLVKKYSASSSVENKLKENQIMPLSQFFNTQISDVPRAIFDSIKRLRLSRTDVLKWMNSHMSLSHLEGFFLRLRLGKWEAGLGGTGYYVSCIAGSQRESCPPNDKKSISVVVGGVRCLVESQYVSNQDFHEEELRAWWSATLKGSGKIPSEADLREKVKRKKMLGL